jgi:hypothetical protein
VYGFTADALVSTGLSKLGYTYVNIGTSKIQNTSFSNLLSLFVSVFNFATYYKHIQYLTFIHYLSVLQMIVGLNLIAMIR